MLKILIYDTRGNLELEAETSNGEVQIHGRMSYLDWLNIKDERDPIRRQDKYVTSPTNQYLDIRWSKEISVPAESDVYSSLEEWLVFNQTSRAGLETKILRLEAEDFLNKKHIIQFFNIVFEPRHPAFEMDGMIVPEALSGYPSFSHSREIRGEGHGLVFERTDYRLRIKATRTVHIDCERYKEVNGELPYKLPEQLETHLYPA